MTRLHVVVERGQIGVLDYHAINVGTTSAKELPKPPRGTPNHGQIPVLFLGHVAVDRKAQGLGIDSLLMHHVFEKVRVIADVAGCYAILLDAMSDGDAEAFKRRKSWYQKFGFQNFENSETRMVITIKDARKLIGD